LVADVKEGVLALEVSLAAVGAATDKDEAADDDDEDEDEVAEEEEEAPSGTSTISMGHSLDMLARRSRPCELAWSLCGSTVLC
jgi:ribosomal protein L12E/L44/L45/RPP1/RPP2